MLISDYLSFYFINKAKTGQTCPKDVYIGCISNINTYVNIMALGAIRNKFKETALGKAAMASAMALPLTLASFGPAANNALAGEPQVVSVSAGEITKEERAIDKARAMRKYSENPNDKGIGILINLQKNAPMTGEQIGEGLRAMFAGLNPPVPLDYRVNQSQGTASDITFYVKGMDFTMTVTDIANEGVNNVAAHHRDLWPQQVSLNTQPQ